MYRWGDKENHSYVNYAGFSKAKAIKNGENEFEYRGHKYESEVIEFTPDDPASYKAITKLDK